ncbi:hypothetical protein DH2020_021690 [Rehmannia glutinosa]|uniref:Uncharacterized protein n=1 Tax=Rehmannia glutinosa TaxID=99300 RepID=A0ABR0WFG8_REHGL
MDDSSKTQSLFPMETCPQVSDEAFNLFHSIDRELYTRLIGNLRRDPAESIQVMAFWMWLEKESKDMNFIKRMLTLPLGLLNEVADETVTCLRCVESDSFLFGDGNGNEITLLPELLRGGRIISLRLFHENRIAVLRSVFKIINTVCTRAFSDILQRVWRVNGAAAAAAAAESGGGNGGGKKKKMGGVPVQFVGPVTHQVGEAERRIEGGGGGVAPPPPGTAILYHHPHLNVAPFLPLPHAAAAGGLIRMAGPPSPGPTIITLLLRWRRMLSGSPFTWWRRGIFRRTILAQRQMLSNELGEMLSRNLNINSREEINNRDIEEEEVPADDRTIFLTFSKGYPITEDEVREFFTRMRFGDLIEELIMQEVGDDEQVLYARMVARSTAVIDGIVGGNKANLLTDIDKGFNCRKKEIAGQNSPEPKGLDHPSCTSDKLHSHRDIWSLYALPLPLKQTKLESVLLHPLRLPS